MEIEKTIADLLAFLSATHDDNCMIRAVCIEESRNHNQLTIRVASNKGDCSYVTNGFDEMAKILQEAHNRVNAKEDDYFKLLRCIIRVDQPKILCRLRSKHAARTRKTLNRRSPLVQLREALDDRSLRKGEVTATDLIELQAKARELESLFTQYESVALRGATNTMALEKMLDIVRRAECFASTSMNKMVYALDSSRTLDPNTKEYLPIAIEKLARYSVASRYLVSTARNRRYTVFNNINVETASIPHPDQPLFQGPFPTLEQAGENVIDAGAPVRGGKITSPIVSFLGQSYNEKARQFSARLCAKSNVWKVHAEIQILVYHELHPKLTKPRVIASSKSACYLCNLFIREHGQFQVPRTHGRIYDRWVFPDWVGFAANRRERMNMVVERFNSRIEETIIGTVMAQRTSRNHPNESVLFSVKELSSSTLTAIPLTTSLPTPPISQTLLHNRIMQVNPTRTCLNHIPLPPMRIAATEDQTPITPAPVLTAVAVNESSQNQEGRPASSSSDGTEKPSFVFKRAISEGQDTKKESECVDSKAEADASTAPSLPSECPPLHEDRPDQGLGHISSHESLPTTVSEDHLASAAILSSDPYKSEHVLVQPGLAISCSLDPSAKEIYIEAGKLHLTLGMEMVAPIQGTQHPADCTIEVRWLDREEQHRLTAANQFAEFINARDIPTGEAITVDRGGRLSKTDLVLSAGHSDTVVSIRQRLGAREKTHQ